MNKAICPTCAGYAMILRSLYENSNDAANSCDFCLQTTAARRITWKAPERIVTTPAVSVLPFYVRGLGAAAIAELAALESQPRPRNALTGPLVKAGFAKTDQQRLLITAEGREYLRLLRLERFKL